MTLKSSQIRSVVSFYSWSLCAFCMSHLCSCILYSSKRFSTTPSRNSSLSHVCPPDFSVQGVLQARLGCCFHCPGDLPGSGIGTHVSCITCIASKFFTTEPPGKPFLGLSWTFFLSRLKLAIFPKDSWFPSLGIILGNQV